MRPKAALPPLSAQQNLSGQSAKVEMLEGYNHEKK
jgi:hypothetical protein